MEASDRQRPSPAAVPAGKPRAADSPRPGAPPGKRSPTRLRRGARRLTSGRGPVLGPLGSATAAARPEPLSPGRLETLRRDHRAADTPPTSLGPPDAPEDGSARLRGARPADGSAQGAGLPATGLLRPRLAHTNGGGLFPAVRSAACCLLRRSGKGQELGGRSPGKSSVDLFLSLPLLFLGEISQHPVSELHLSSVT